MVRSRKYCCFVCIQTYVILVIYIHLRINVSVLNMKSRLNLTNSTDSNTNWYSRTPATTNLNDTITVGPVDVYSKPITIVIWTPYYNLPSLNMLKNLETRNWFPSLLSCPVSCRFTAERKYLQDADAVIFHSHPNFGTIRRSQLPTFHMDNQIWIYYTEESPMLLMLDFKATPNVFNWTMTYRKDSDVFNPYGEVVKIPTNFDNTITRNVSSSRRKFVAWTASRCLTSSKRENYILELRKHIPIDIYGGCGTLSCQGKWPDGCFAQIARDYKFYLAFENSLCTDYVTEKFFKSLMYSIVPVVYGHAEYSKIAPKDSFIDTRDFEGPKQLAEYLLHLDKSPEEYGKYFEWRLQNKVLPPGGGWCKLCRMLENRDRRERKWYKDLWKWWTSNGEGGEYVEEWKLNYERVSNTSITKGNREMEKQSYFNTGQANPICVLPNVLSHITWF